LGCLISRTPGSPSCITIAAVASVEPSSTTITSKSPTYSLASKEVTVAAMPASSL
jgi:hypothetical protein